MSDTSSVGSVTMSAYSLESNYLVRGLGNCKRLFLLIVVLWHFV